MAARDGDVALRGVDAGDRSTQAGHRLGQQAAAATDVEQPKARERRKEILTPGRIEIFEGDGQRFPNQTLALSEVDFNPKLEADDFRPPR